MLKTVSQELTSLTSVEAAKRLVGCEIVRLLDGEVLRGRIVETEAYDQQDAASHSFNGRTARTDVMFGPAGYWYVYFTYGMHYCCNVVVGPKGYGAAVLIRAIEPLQGEHIMQRRRLKSGAELTNGPAKLCQALVIDRALNGANAGQGEFIIELKKPLTQIVTTTRIGISKAKDVPWRFYDPKSDYVSRKI